jgi:hypothetical protein
MITNDMPLMTEDEQWEMRIYLALSHQDGKCCVYTDDGELQCNNMLRHGRCLDFRREKISDLLQNIQATRMLESEILEGNVENIKPTDIVATWNKK